MSMTAVTEEILLDRIKSGRLVEDSSHATERYIEGLKRTLIVSADTELISAPAYMNATKDFSTLPSVNNYITVMGIVQDELGHAHIAYRMLRDLGVDTEELVYERKAHQFKYPYAFDVPLDSFTELVVGNGFYDRAGFVLLSDIHHNCSYGPWKRALVKVDREENFHLRHGEKWMKVFSKDPEKKKELQRAVDWMFMLTLEWFGLPDGMKKHNEQIEYGYKGSTNDELRQTWMSHTVPLSESLGLDVPGSLRRGDEEIRHRRAVPVPLRRGGETLGLRRGPDKLGRGHRTLESSWPEERGVRRPPAARLQGTLRRGDGLGWRRRRRSDG